MKQLFILVMLMVAISSHAHVRDSFAVYFPLNKSELTTAEQQKIDSLIYHDLIFPSQTLSILGYTDYLASDEYNMKLSQQRAENVKAYLVKSGFTADNIILCIGKGKLTSSVDNGKSGNSADRKVVIAIVRKTRAPLTKTKEIKALKVNETMALNNISFWPGSANVLAQSMPELKKLYDAMTATPTLKIRIEGHICCDPQNVNFLLSVQRAKTVYAYLINKGIDSSRLDYKGYGTANPVVDPEVTEEDRIKNRRVEIRILKK